jgi:predicted Zn-dependent protease
MLLLERMTEALSAFRGSEAGIAAWRLFATRSRSVSLGVKDNEAGNVYAPLTRQRGESLRYQLHWSDGRVSRGAMDRGGAASLETALRAARQASYLDPDAVAAGVGGAETFPEVPLHDPGTAAMLGGEIDPLSEVLSLIREEVARRGFGTYSGHLHAGEGEQTVRSSAGLEASSRGCLWGYSVHFEGEFGDSLVRRRLAPPAESAARIAISADLVERLRSAEEDGSSGTLPVLFHPRLVESLLSSYLLGNLSGRAVFHGQSAFRLEQFERQERLFRPDLRLGAEPTRSWSVGSYRFTSEGVPAAPVDFIREGRLVSPVLDRKYAHRLGRAPTPLPSAADTLVLEGPERMPLPEALESVGHGLYALSLLGLHTQDTTRGDFSLSAPQALAIRDGALAGRRKAVLAGDFLGALAGPDLRLVEVPHFELPGLLFPCRVHPLAS